MSAPHALGGDAQMVLGMASTAMPFARSSEDEAEHWLRILRLHGRAGSALQALGVSEAPLESVGHPPAGERADAVPGDGRDVVATVGENAARIAEQRGAQQVATTDVLVAVMEVYGADFDRVLWAHGTESDEVLERLGVATASAADD